MHSQLAGAEQLKTETDKEIALLRAEHTHFRSELARYQARDASSRPVPSSLYSRGPESVVASTSWDRSADPLRAQVEVGHFGVTIGHNCTCGGNRFYNASGHNGECECEKARRRKRASGIIPGAPASRKVIPPLPPARSALQDHYAPSAYGEADYSLTVPTIPAQRTFDQSERTPRATESLDTRPMMGSFSTRSGYVPLDDPSLAAAAEAEERPVVGELRLFSEPIDSVTDGMAYAPRTVEAAARALVVSAGDLDTAESTWSRVRHAGASNTSANRFASSLSVASADMMSISVDEAAESSGVVSPTISLSDLGILVAPITSIPARTASTRTVPQEIPRNSPSPVPSEVSTWGTNPSIRSSRSMSVQDLNLVRLPSAMNLTMEPSPHNASLADLHLANLPERPFSLIGATAGGHAGPSEGRSETPRAFTSESSLSVRVEDRESSAHSVAVPSSRHSLAQPSVALSAGRRVSTRSQEDEVLGQVTSSLAGTQISSQQDLQQVDGALRQLLEERRVQRRQSRYTPAPAFAGESADSQSHAQDRNPQATTRRASGVADGHPPPVPVSTRPADLTSASSSRRPGDDPQNLGSAAFLARRRSTYDENSGPPASLRSGHARSVSLRIEIEAPAAVGSPDLAAVAQQGTVWSPLGIAASQSRDALIDGGSLLLNFAPAATSTASTSSGSPVAIHAPRPVDRRQNRFFGFLNDPRQRH